MISVVIPAFNEDKSIGPCLEAFTRQKNAPDFEVILVNNASTDRTRTEAERFLGKLDLKIVDDPIKGRGHARNTGFKMAAGEIILSTDSDSIVPDDWVQKMTGFLNENPDIAAVSGTCKIVDQSPSMNKQFNWFQPFSMRVYRVFSGHYWLTGSNFAIRRGAYNKAGGFDPGVNGQEDIELAYRVARIGKISLIPDLPITSSGRRFEKGLIKGLFQYGKVYFEFFWKNKRTADLDDSR